MSHNEVALTLISCVFFMGLVAVVAYYKTRGQADTQEGYFLAGRSLSGVFIAGSLLLTNLSAEQLIGLNGSAYGFNLTSMAWEVTAGIAIIVMALIFLPRYLKGAFTTLPEFLSARYDDSVRRYSVVLFMLGYGLVTIPSVLYSGSVAVLQLFDVPGLLGVSYSSALVVTILAIGGIGSLYAVFGGLKAVAVSDTLNGVGLLIIGVLVPVLGLQALGDGSVTEGIALIATTHTEKLNAVGTADDPIPFGTIFTGMLFANLFYWGTNQYVIQRTLGARNLAEGQKGVLLSGYYKLLVPFMMMIPGTIAYHLYGDTLPTIDLAYPTLVRDLLPVYLSGFFLAVLLGAVFSSFNSLLNSAATMWVLDVYVPLRKEKLSNRQIVRMAKITSVVIAIFSFVVSPLLQYAPQGLWEIIRVFTGFYSIPTIAVVLVGLFTRRVPPLAAKAAIVFHVLAYGLIRFVLNWDVHYVHVYGMLFFVDVALMLLIGWLRPCASRIQPNMRQHTRTVDMTPWRLAIPAALVLLAMIVLLYMTFSSWGLVGGLSASYGAIVAGIIAVTATGCWLSIKYSAVGETE